jgi:hypothetical protein
VLEFSQSISVSDPEFLFFFRHDSASCSSFIIELPLNGIGHALDTTGHHCSTPGPSEAYLAVSDYLEAQNPTFKQSGEFLRMQAAAISIGLFFTLSVAY